MKGDLFMEDKTFELLEKMYSEFVQFREETNEQFKGINEQFKGVNEQFKEVNEQFKEVNGNIIRIENDHGRKLDVLLDGYKQNSEAITEINHKLDRLTDRVENQEIKLQVLKSVK